MTYKKNYLIAILNLLQEIVNGSAGSIIAYAVIINKTYSVIVYKWINKNVESHNSLKSTYIEYKRQFIFYAKNCEKCEF